MSLKNVKSSLSTISKSLAISYDSREYLIKNTREVVILSSQAIISIHKGDRKVAKLKIKKAQNLLRSFRKKANGELNRYLITPEQELVEAFALLAIVEKKNVPDHKTISVSNESYVLGLLDCVGELKRLIFDNIRVGNSKEATRIFEIMENLYLHLYPFASYDKILKEARRKLDINRVLVENARAALTEEIRRTDLINAIKKITK